MNRRQFLAASAATTALASTTSAPARQSGRLKVIVPPMNPAELDDLKAVASDLELVACRSEAEAIEQAPGAVACYGFITPGVIRAGKSLRWVQQPSAGVEGRMEIPELVDSAIILTNMQRVYAPEIADQALGYVLAFTRSPSHFIRAQPAQEWRSHRPGVVLDELLGKTLLVIGLGGIGSEIARRAHAFGMRVLATDPKVLERPLYVEELHRPDAFHTLLPRAHVVASAVPLTRQSRGMIAAREFGMMKRGVILINVSRGKVVDTAALVAALDSGQVAAAGLDVTDPEPLPKGHPLWSRNVLITPHSAGQSPGGERRRHELFRENLRRFAAGEMLLNVVDKRVGY
jgi:phosphoglycerate dehydrogenase-like enzyme